MSVLSLLHDLATHKVRIWLDADQLRFKAAKGALTPELRARLKAQKEAIIAHLGKELSIRKADKAITRADRSKPLPLSYAQQRLWFIEQWDPGKPTYNISFCDNLRGHLDTRALQMAFADLLLRHESLRTRFPSRSGQPYQDILATIDPSIEFVDMSCTPESMRERLTRAWVSELARQPFSLAEGPLFRIGLGRLASDSHVLMVVLHHIIADGWSLDVFLSEWGDFYRARLQKTVAALEPLAIQYPDYAVWQRAWLDDGEMSRQMKFWEGKLAQPRPNSELATDKMRPKKLSYRGGLHFFTIDPAVFAVLRKYRENDGATPFMTFLTAFLILLNRHSGQMDLLVGTPVAQRDRRELENMIGFLVNTLVIRADLQASPTFAELHRQVQATTLASFARGDVPFEKLVELLQPDRDPSRNPLMQVMFSMQNNQRKALELPGLTLTAFAYEAHVAHFDMTFGLEIQGDDLAGFIEYSTDLFEADTIARMANRFQILLAGIAANTQQPIGDYELMSDSEQKALLAGWREMKLAQQEDEGLLARLEASIREHRHDQACQFGSEQFGFVDLKRLANQLVGTLGSRGVGLGSRVALDITLSPQFLVAIVAIAKLGGVAVPLNRAWPESVMSEVLGKAKPVLVLANSTASPTRQNHLPLLNIDTLSASETPNSNSLDFVGNMPMVECYATDAFGEVHGVIHDLASLLAAVDALADRGISSGSSVAMVLAATHPLTIGVLWAAMIHGAEIWIYDDSEQTAPHDLGAWLNQNWIQTLVSTVAMLSDEGLATATLDDWLLVGNGLDHFQIGEHLQGSNCYHFVYSTETGGIVGMSNPMLVEEVEQLTMSVARSDTFSLQVSEYFDRLAPLGVPGEIWIGETGFTNGGFVNDPARTALFWVPDPFSAQPGSRRMRTGDRGRILANDCALVLSRSDRETRINGYRLNLARLEACLGQHPGVARAHVAIQANEKNTSILVAWIQPAATHGALARLSAFLEDLVVRPCIPTQWREVDLLAVDGKGRVLLSELPVIAVNAPSNQEEAEPRTPHQWAMAMIWADVLGLNQIRLTDHFFSLGGHSLMAVKILARVSDVFEQQLSIRTLFEYPTLRAFTDQLAAVGDA